MSRETGVWHRASPFLLALESRAWLEWGATAAAWPWLVRSAESGDGHPVLSMPGWLGGDGSTWLLRRFLRKLGYWAHGWGQGVNSGPSPDLALALDRRLDALLDRHGQPVSLIGWSLGGLYARELARQRPDAVRCVITLASPLRAGVGDMVRAMFADVLDRDHTRYGDPNTLAVPHTALYSRSDGIVAWRSALAPTGQYSESVEVATSHCGMGHHPAALWVIADRLATPARAWRPWKPRGVTPFVLGVRTAAS